MPRLLIILSALIVASASLGAKSVFLDAVPGRALSFPKDHGKHPDFQTEWWYFTETSILRTTADGDFN